MVDRLEELLTIMETEDEDEKREDALALTDRTVPGVSPERDDGEAAPAGDGDARADQGAPLAAEDQAFGRENLPGDGPAEDTAIPAEDVWRWKLAETAGEGAAARMAEKAPLETPGMRRSVEQDGEPVQAVAREAQSGLEALYRRTAQAGRPPVQNLPVEQAGRTRRAEEPGRAAALTVDELDRAVRRDSRRYDGCMSIF